MLEYALNLARQGNYVFPLNPDKTPRTPNGFKDATRNFDRLKEFNWDDAWLGAALPEGVIVVDIDPRNGGNQTLSLFPGLPINTPTVKTGGGGMHVYLKVDPSLKLRGTLGPGVDIKRHGKGYVVVPPSPGYEWVYEGRIANAPKWLVDELIVEERTGPEAQASGAKYMPWENGTAYGLSALEREAGKLAMAGEGGRNNALNAAAFAMGQLHAGGEIDRQHAYDTLASVAYTIGLVTHEIEATFDSGFKAGEQEPRQAPNNPQPVASTPSSTASALEAFGQVTEIDESKLWVDWAIDEPELPFYVWPLLPKNAYLTVYGATEASKSMAWVGILAEASKHGVKTSVYSLENPPATDRQRLRRWNPDPQHFRLTNEPLDFNDIRQLDALIKRETEWGTDVILIDTYSHAFNSRSEDGNAKAIEFARRCRFVMAKVGCSIITIDHTGYMQADEPRDASAKRQQVDVAILMKKAGVWTPGQPSRFTMENKKAARFANPFFLTGEIIDAPGGGLELGWVGDSPRWHDA